MFDLFSEFKKKRSEEKNAVPKGQVLFQCEDVSICEYPPFINSHDENRIVSIGDLHGNSIKLVFFSIAEGVVAMSKEEYAKLALTYLDADDSGKQPEKNDNDVRGFTESLKKMTKREGPQPLLLLIGDDVADRGKNDNFTFSTYVRINELDINWIGLASNHGIEFIKQYAFGLDKELKLLYKGQHVSFGRSFYGLRNSILRKNPQEQKDRLHEIEDTMRKHYFPHLKMLYYSMEVNENSKDRITVHLYSHAPTCNKHIKNLAYLLNAYQHYLYSLSISQEALSQRDLKEYVNCYILLEDPEKGESYLYYVTLNAELQKVNVIPKALEDLKTKLANSKNLITEGDSKKIHLTEKEVKEIIKGQSKGGHYPVPYLGTNAKDLAKTIDLINVYFQNLLMDKDQLRNFFLDLERMPGRFNILDQFVNDRYEDLTAALEDDEKRDYDVINLHGHVGECHIGEMVEIDGIPGWRYQNIDTQIGMPNKFMGLYCTHVQNKKGQVQVSKTKTEEEPKPIDAEQRSLSF